MLKMKTQDERRKIKSLLVSTSTQKSSGTLQFSCIVVMYDQHLSIPVVHCTSHTWSSGMVTMYTSQKYFLDKPKFLNRREMNFVWSKARMSLMYSFIGWLHTRIILVFKIPKWKSKFRLAHSVVRRNFQSLRGSMRESFYFLKFQNGNQNGMVKNVPFLFLND
jgi:hypothetical protein